MKSLSLITCDVAWTSSLEIQPKVFYKGELVTVDAIIPRIAASYTFYGAAVVRQFEMGGVLTSNSSLGISQSRNKLRCHQLLSRKGVDMPITGFAHNIHDIDALLGLCRRHTCHS